MWCACTHGTGAEKVVDDEDGFASDSSRSRAHQGAELDFCGLLGSLAEVIMRCPLCVLFMVVVLTLLNAYGAANFLDVTTDVFEPTPAMDSYEEQNRFEEIFPGVVTSTEVALLLEVTPPMQVLAVPGLKDFSFRLRDVLNSTLDIGSFSSNATLWFERGIPAASQLLSQDGTATLITWTFRTKPQSKEAKEATVKAGGLVDDLVNSMLPEISFHGLAGLSAAVEAVEVSGREDLMKMDAISIPLALAMMSCFVRSWRLLLVPLICLSSSASMSFGIMYWVGLWRPVFSTTPSLMMSILIGMSIDYSLFLLTRFTEELNRVSQGLLTKQELGLYEVREAVVVAMQTAGFMVTLSGGLLTISFLGLMACPFDLLASLGCGCAVALVLTIGIHLAVVPAVLTAFPSFFCYGLIQDKASVNGRRLQRRLAVTDREDNMDADSLGVAARVWQSLAEYTTALPANLFITILVVAGAVAVSVYLPGLQVSSAVSILLPRNSEVQKTFDRMVARFGAGMSVPYYILMEAEEGGTVLSQDFFNKANEVLGGIGEDIMRQDETTFYTITQVGEQVVPEFLAVGCIDVVAQDASARTGTCAPFLHLVETYTNTDRSATWGYVRPTFDAMNYRGAKYLKALRESSAKWSERTGIRVTVTGNAAVVFDVAQRLYELLPWLVAISLSIVLLVMGLVFRSLFIPLRSVVSIVLTLLWVYGLSVLTYQYGIWDWTGLACISGEFKALAWAPPMVCLSMIIGVCLDYDIFIVSRITEFRAAGKSPTDAIQSGLTSTGGIITAAGLIMSIAFGGMLFSSTVPINMLAFFMVSAVLYDTFVVRSLFTPATMSLLGRYNWWPNMAAFQDAPPPSRPSRSRPTRPLLGSRDTA